MCIVIDTNTLGKVFRTDDKKHSEFEPVLKWILESNGKIIVGGTDFNRELFGKIDWFRRFFIQLKDLNKVVVVDDSKVDAHQVKIMGMKKHRDFDDPHIVALLATSKCRVLCTGDSRSFPFVQDRSFYPKNVQPPSIYSKKKNAGLLCNENIADCCLPKVKLSKKTVAKIKI